MIAEAPAAEYLADKAVRKQIDRSISRALIDGEYQRLLLSDPTVALEDCGCSRQQFNSLRSIDALDLDDFARQARALFWLGEPTPSRLEVTLSLVAAAR
jgi:hypothetical protein